MQGKVRTRIGSLLLSIIMLLSLLPVTALADGETGFPGNTQQTGATEGQDINLADLRTAHNITTAEELQNTIDTAAEGQEITITLAANIDVENIGNSTVDMFAGISISQNKVIVLDLNGYKINARNDGYAIGNHGTLTINDSSADKTGIICHTGTAVASNYGHDTIRNFGTLTINGGTFGDCDKDQANANPDNRGASVRNQSGATCTINDGFFTCGDNYWVWGTGTGYSYAIRNMGTMTINNATLYGAMNGGIASEGFGTLTINGGSFSVTGPKSYYVLATGGSGTIAVTDGTFTKMKGNGSLLGSFSGMPSWDASGELEENGYVIAGGTFILDGEKVNMTPVAQIGETMYTDLTEAFGNAKDGDIITILAGTHAAEERTEIPVNKAVTIQGEGNRSSVLENYVFNIESTDKAESGHGTSGVDHTMNVIFQNLGFTGSSQIKVGFKDMQNSAYETLETTYLTVDNCYAYLTADSDDSADKGQLVYLNSTYNTNLDLTIQNSTLINAHTISAEDKHPIVNGNGTNIVKATITGNIFGSAEHPCAGFAVKFGRRQDNAVFSITDNTVYATAEADDFCLLDLWQSGRNPYYGLRVTLERNAISCTVADAKTVTPAYIESSVVVTGTGRDGEAEHPSAITASGNTVNGVANDTLLAEARIDDCYYGTFTDAYELAEDGDTIQILDDITLTSTINAKKTLTFEGVTKPDGSKPVISCEDGIFSQSGTAVYTLKNLELQAVKDEQWYIYHSAGALTIENCDFTMADGVTHTGNVVMSESIGTAKSLIFKNNTITANSRAALVGMGNGSVITGNTIDLISEKYDNTTSRTSIISLTAVGGESAQVVTITGNTFKNANRAIAVDSSTLNGSKIIMEDNTFEQVRFAFELSPTKNAEYGPYDLSRNSYTFTENDETITELKVQDADSEGNKFIFGEGSTEYKPQEASLVVTAISLSLDKSSAALYSNTTPNTVQLNATVTTDSANKSVTWISSNTSVATVSDTGLVTAVGNGTAVITAKAGPAEATCTVTVSTYSSSGSSSGGSSSGTTTETEKNPDGSTTTTVTKPDGSTTETTKQPNGSTTTVATDKNGNVETTVKLPSAVVSEAAEKGEAVALPMDSVKVSSDSDDASPITVDLPSNTSAKVEIPVADVTAGTVAILVKADGTEQVIKTTLTTENGVAVTLADGDTVKIVDNSKDFDDVEEDYWGSSYIDFATSRELFSGTSESAFSPETVMTRGMIVTVLAAYDGADTTSASGEVWYTAGQKWAMLNGISDGTNMNGSLNREQLAVMLWSYAGKPAPTGNLSSYVDADSTSDWAADALTWAVENGLISGMDDGTLNPQGLATRAQVATIMTQFVALTA